ncbi:Sodium/pyruvate cotransporter BASS2, chloroplastic [Galdieria sulphuraria]|nr:Sodium/pyruvate cotransporter BASS2, chloroplastic [Galdieria sulphuraria]
MFSVGSTLSLKDFVPVLKSPLPVLLGFIGCYILMPFLSVFISRFCGFHYEYYAGMILLGCVSGGQASNLSTYIAKGDVALSVAMTTISTLASVFMLPTLSKLFLGTVIPISVECFSIRVSQS